MHVYTCMSVLACMYVAYVHLWSHKRHDPSGLHCILTCLPCRAEEDNIRQAMQDAKQKEQAQADRQRIRQVSLAHTQSLTFV